MILIFYHRRPLYCLIYRNFFTGSTKQFILGHTNITEKEYDENYRKNWWLDANEIIEKGVADHIITDISQLF